jgi:hypothetical protein
MERRQQRRQRSKGGKGAKEATRRQQGGNKGDYHNGSLGCKPCSRCRRVPSRNKSRGSLSQGSTWSSRRVDCCTPHRPRTPRGLACGQAYVYHANLMCMRMCMCNMRTVQLGTDAKIRLDAVYTRGAVCARRREALVDVIGAIDACKPRRADTVPRVQLVDTAGSLMAGGTSTFVDVRLAVHACPTCHPHKHTVRATHTHADAMTQQTQQHRTHTHKHTHKHLQKHTHTHQRMQSHARTWPTTN